MLVRHDSIILLIISTRSARRTLSDSFATDRYNSTRILATFDFTSARYRRQVSGATHRITHTHLVYNWSSCCYSTNDQKCRLGGEHITLRSAEKHLNIRKEYIVICDHIMMNARMLILTDNYYQHHYTIACFVSETIHEKTVHLSKG